MKLDNNFVFNWERLGAKAILDGASKKLAVKFQSIILKESIYA